MSENFNFFLPLTKIDKDARTVSGYCSTPTLDLDGEVVSLEAIKKALPGYWDWRAVREMHGSSAVGVGKEAHADEKGMFLTAKIVDDAAWNKVIEEVYKGFSIGGRKLAKKGNTITEIEWIETSLVDRPANPDCRFTVAKRAKNSEGAFLLKTAKAPGNKNLSKALLKMAEVSEFLAKADNPPAAQDGFSLPAKTACKAHGKVDCEECAKEATAGEIAKTENPNLADDISHRADKKAKKIKKREVGDKERENLASQGKALPGGGFPIKDKSDLDNARQAVGRAKDPGAARALIRRRASELGVSLPEGWKKKAARSLIAKAESDMAEAAKAKTSKGARGAARPEHLSYLSSPATPPPFLSLKKTGVKSLNAGDGVLETVPSPLSLGDENGGPSGRFELTKSTTDTLVEFLESEDFVMPENTNGSALDNAIQDLIKRASQPSRAQRMQMAQGNLKKAKDARKECAAAIKAAHAMHKSAYLRKEAIIKSGKKPKDDGDADDFDHEEAMSKLQKAYNELEKVSTFTKAAREQLKKVGQTAQSPTTGEADYKVPSGVSSKSQSELTEGKPPLMPTEGGVYPGKAAKFAKNGQVSAEVAELLAENARLEGQADALSKISARDISGRGPMSFDMTKLGIGGRVNAADPIAVAVQESGVNPQALVSDDDQIRKTARAKVAGSFILNGSTGKSILDPSFHGAAGGRE